MSKGIDLIGANGQAQGELAQLIVNSKMDPSAYKPWINPDDGRTYITVHKGGDRTSPKNYKHVPLQTNGTLRRDEWKHLDEAVLTVARQRLGGVQDLIDNNLTYNLGNPLGTTVLEWHRSQTNMTAAVDMDGEAQTQNARPIYDTQYMPIPIIHQDYQINERELRASRSLGNPISTDAAEEAARAVRETLEDMLYTTSNTPYTFGGGKIYSYLNHPDVNTGTLTSSWTASATTATEIKDDLLSMIQDAIDNNHHGPFKVYVPRQYATILGDDYSVSGGSYQTIQQRLEAINGIQGIKVVDRMPDDTVLLVEMSSRNVRLVRGMDMQNIQWTSGSGMTNYFKVMTVQVPQIRSDMNGSVGIVKYTV